MYDNVIEGVSARYRAMLRGQVKKMEGQQQKENVATPQQQQEKAAVFYAVISASQSPGHLGYAEGITTIKEARNLVVQAVPERRGRLAKTAEESVLAYFPSPLEALKAAIAIERAAVENRDKRAPLNVRVFIHSGDDGQTVETLQAELIDFATRTSEITKPGHIYVSTEACGGSQALNAVEFRPFSDAAKTGQKPYYDVTWRPETDCTPGGTVSAQALKGVPSKSTGTFLHGQALLTGPNPPCFYCGSGRHRTTVCPSKQLSYATNGLEQLGHFSMDGINKLFGDYLAEAGGDLPILAEPVSGNQGSNPTYLAPWAFFALRRVFQLRFLDVVWNAPPKEDWYKARETKREGSPEGGLLWLARDCIRTSRLEEAEELLKRYDKKAPTDYRTPIGLAFIKIEKENYITAGDFFIEALNLPTTPLQKTYILLMLSRIYEFIGDTGKSDDRLRDALGIEPFCPEGIFEQVVRLFRARKETDATNRLIKLLHSYKEYYTAALVAPELTKFQAVIGPELEKIVDKAREDAQTAAGEAEKAVTALVNFAGDADTDVADVLADFQRMKDLLEGPEALFNYTDVVNIGQQLTEQCAEIDKERVTDVAKVVRKLEVRMAEIARSTSQPKRARSLLQPVVEGIAKAREDVKARALLADVLSRCEEITNELEQIADTIREMDASHARFMMWARFSKDLLLAFFITAAVGFVIFPGAMNLFRAMGPDFTLLKPPEMWGAQKAIVLAGFLFAIMFAGFRAFMLKHNPQREGE
jgi:tetratricopeptide (TPR) repeat protein